MNCAATFTVRQARRVEARCVAVVTVAVGFVKVGQVAAEGAGHFGDRPQLCDATEVL